ncbi:MAG: hypothetical protein DWQ42_15795 [Planctomycetota bacterium]|nr:MAG: hypothetical protein DWQ42_15795 [Planctomycetota bacterium]REK49372.1 MAG: hypothetical protein DWQ46_00475 [Planctomycetota bacterium]
MGALNSKVRTTHTKIQLLSDKLEDTKQLQLRDRVSSMLKTLEERKQTAGAELRHWESIRQAMREKMHILASYREILDVYHNR